MKHILVTGAAGFVGQHLVSHLAKNRNFSVRAFVQKENTINGLPVDWVDCGDIREYESLRKVFLKNPLDVVVHLAAVIKSPKREDYFTVNVNGTENLVRLSERYGAKKFIFLSTDFLLYNVPHPYGESKHQCEEILSNSTLDFTIFRPTPIYGLNDTKNFATLISLIEKWPVIPAVRCEMEPVYVGDVVKMITAAVEYPKTSRQIYNLPGGSFDEFQEILGTISRLLKLKRLIIPISGNFFLPALKLYENLFPRPLLESYQVEKWLQNRSLDASNTQRDLGYRPLTFKEGMQLTINKQA